jgi:hypothetical protein
MIVNKKKLKKIIMITSKKNCKIRQTMYLNYKPIKYEIMKLDEKKDEKTGSSQFELA